MSNASILIVEDEKIIARGIEKRLRALGYHIAGLAATGAEAIRFAAESRPDLILMDINLGAGMDGVEAAELLRVQLDVPIVYLTAFSDNATLQRAKLTEPFGYILKPYDDKDLQSAIEIGLYKHKMDLRLRENERWLAATLGSIGDGVIAVDQLGKVRLFNAWAEKLTGWTEAEALGRDVGEVFNIVDEKTRQPVSNPIFEALEKGVPANLAPETTLIDKFGVERPIDDSAAPIRDVNGNVSGAVLVFRDVSERRRLEEHLRQSQKMDAIGRLAGGIAHDFNNIMTVVLGYCEILLANRHPHSVDIEPLSAILDAGKRGVTLTQQIMAFSRKQMLAPVVLNLNTVVRDLATMIQRLIGANIELQTRASTDLGLVKVDPTQIGQVLLNLAANARDAMPGSGQLTITTSNVDLLDPITQLHPEITPGQYVILEVRDTGCGIPEENLTRVFEPFFTTKEIGKGTGLGLATVHGIAKQSGGHIEVSSQVGEGTTFRIYLPRVEGMELARNVQDTSVVTKGQETILLVDDEDAVRQISKRFLQKAGYHVLEASNGIEAITVFENHQAPIHLLLTDLIMPKMSGQELAERLTGLDPKLRVLFMSGFNEDMVSHQGLTAAELLPKPFNLVGLTKKVRDVLDRS